MTLTSFFLVTFERENAASQRAGAEVLRDHPRGDAVPGGGRAAALAPVRLVPLRRAARRRSRGCSSRGRVLAHVVLALLFLGFATKAGVLPMGDWLPDAHPVAPSGMSAALSGALVKLGIYGLVRFFCALLPASAAAGGWGIAIALAGHGVAVRRHPDGAPPDRQQAADGVPHDRPDRLHLPRPRRRHRLSAGRRRRWARSAIMGALFHAANHACFKACLFLGAGAVLYRTGERDMNRLGGLAAAMPLTAGVVDGRLAGHRRRTAAQRLRQQVADRRHLPAGRDEAAALPAPRRSWRCSSRSPPWPRS